MATIGKYEIVEELGRGGMGVVYKAYDPVMERDVAIKVVSDIMTANPEMRDRFLREARTAGKLSHENITIVHDVGEDAGKPFIVMEYLGGDDLGHLIGGGRPMSLQDKLSYAIQICRGLAFLHARGFIHRDIKPANIRIVSGKVKIMDFGIARTATSELTKSGAIIGTPFYMSPEQIRGQKVDHRSDIFSFGVLLYELLSGEKPFTGDEPTTVMYKIVHEDPSWAGGTMIRGGSPLREVLTKLLAKNPDERYRDLSETAADLERILSSVKSGGNRADDASTVLAGISTSTARSPSASAAGSGAGRGQNPRPKRWLYYTGGGMSLLIVLAVLMRVTVFAPGKHHGYVGLNILPWAEVLKVADADRNDFPLKRKTYTPCTLELPEGLYEIQLINPELASSMSVTVQVREGERQDIVRKFDSLDYQEVLTMIQGPDSTAR
ncbi:MAG TPA: serine/threonine-protein kinase [Bacteroidota bacterium]|nr:serine/threonine-protein kinase [Bacteroidota bacterium]